MKDRKIVLISTFPDIQAYGIRIISSVLKGAGFKTNLVFLNAPFGDLYSQEVLEKLLEVSRDALFVGVSLMTNFFERAKQISLFLKEHLKEVPVIWGGVHTALKPDECLLYADMVCIGEAEKIIAPLAESLMRSDPPGQLNNIWFKANGETIKNRIAPFPDNINGLPFPDYEYPSHFIIDNNRLVPMDLKRMEQYMGYEYSTIATRGCFYNCTFCANNFFEKHFHVPNTMKLRSRGMEDIIGELSLAKKRLSFIRIFKFSDDLFMALPKETIEKFCRLYRDSGLKLPLDITGIHPLILKEDKFKLLVEAGLKYVRMGIQSGNQGIRKLYGRNETNDKIMEGVRVIHKYRKRLKAIRYDFMVDNPWEAEEDIKDSLRLLAKIPKPYKINVFSLTLYPGTELYNKAKEEGVIKDESSQIYNKHYHDNVSASYYNELFKIISIYRLPKRCFMLLIEDKSNPLAKMIYFVLRSGAQSVSRLKRLAHLVKEGVSDIKEGNLERINKFIFMRPRVVH